MVNGSSSRGIKASHWVGILRPITLDMRAVCGKAPDPHNQPCGTEYGRQEIFQLPSIAVSGHVEIFIENTIYLTN